jgi:uncharacterized membrane protein (DUF485 family)
MSKSFLLISFLLAGSHCLSQTASPQNAIAPTPALVVSLERQAIREKDCIPVEIWLSSDGKHELSDVTSQIASPAFVKVDRQPCAAKDHDVAEQIKLSSGPSPNIYHLILYLKTGPDITVGDYSLLFTIHYQWKLAKDQGRSLVAVEKPIKVNFLGSDNVAGVPLGLASLIVPGLFFWLVVRLFGISWSVETALGDRLIYSVIISFIFVALGSMLLAYASWLHYLDVSNGISITKLIWLAASGTVIGFIVGLIHLRRATSKRKDARSRINFDDDEQTIIQKLLRRTSIYNPSPLVRLVRTVFPKKKGNRYVPQTVVRLKNGQEYIGSLGVKEADLTTLAGWFKVTKDTSKAQVVTNMEQLVQKDRLFDLFRAAKKEKFAIGERNRIRARLQPGADLTPADAVTKRWASDEVLQLIVKIGEPGATPPLTLD